MTEERQELAILDTRIGECKQHITEQRERVARMKQLGKNTEDSEQLLSNLLHSLAALEQLRELVLQEVKDAQH